jgi:hypothetical protein
LALAAVRTDVIHPDHPDTTIRSGDLDDVWLPVVGDAGLILITRDKRIRYRLAEKRLLRKHAVRGLFLTQAGRMTMWEILRMVMTNWDRIEEIAGEPGPWIRSLTRAGINDLVLPES